MQQRHSIAQIRIHPSSPADASAPTAGGTPFWELVASVGPPGRLRRSGGPEAPPRAPVALPAPAHAVCLPLTVSLPLAQLRRGAQGCWGA